MKKLLHTLVATSMILTPALLSIPMPHAALSVKAAVEDKDDKKDSETIKQEKERLKEKTKEWEKDVTPEQKDMLEHLSDKEKRDEINNHLKEKKEPLNKEWKEKIEKIDKILEEAPKTEQDMTVYTSITSTKDLKKGSIVEEKGYLVGTDDIPGKGADFVIVTIPAGEPIISLENGDILTRRDTEWKISEEPVQIVIDADSVTKLEAKLLPRNENKMYTDLLNTSLQLDQKLIDFDVKDVENIKHKYEIAREMTNRIGKIEKNILEKLTEKQTYIKLIDYPLTDTKEYSNLKGVIPRGWEGAKDAKGKQLTWDDVPGAGSQENRPVIARIGYSDRGNGHSTINLELHETAHAIDRVVFRDISHNPWFEAPFHEEQKKFLPDRYFENKEEYFAECFAYYYFNDVSRKELQEKAPVTYSYMETLIETMRKTPHYFDK